MKSIRLITLLAGLAAFIVISGSNVLNAGEKPVQIRGLSCHCTTIAVGKKATVDGSTLLVGQIDDSCGDPRTWLIPAQDFPEGAVRDIVVQLDIYVDFTQLVDPTYPVPPTYYPENTCYGPGWKAMKVGEMPQVPHTYAYFFAGNAFLNEKGVAIALSSHGPWYDEEKYRVLIEESPGIIDEYGAQTVAMERASTAREAVRIMGDLINKYQWWGKHWGCTTMCVADGDEVWVFEVYGRDLWAAVKIPDDHVFIAGNSARIRRIDFDSEDVMYSPNLVSFAVEQGWFDPDAGEPFSPAEIYSPRTKPNFREWRVFDLVAPSLHLNREDLWQPFSVKPDYKLSVSDLFEILGDTLEGTEFDLTKAEGSGPWGNPFTAKGPRTVFTPNASQWGIAQVKDWLPDPIKAIAWLGTGPAVTSYPTPLWPSMKKIPKFFYQGIKCMEPYREDSLWWVILRVQQLVQLRYCDAIQDLRNFRDPKLQMLYEVVPLVQQRAAEIYESDPDMAMSLIQNFAYNNAVGMFEQWKELGDFLLGKYARGMIYFKKER